MRHNATIVLTAACGLALTGCITVPDPELQARYSRYSCGDLLAARDDVIVALALASKKSAEVNNAAQLASISTAGHIGKPSIAPGAFYWQENYRGRLVAIQSAIKDNHCRVHDALTAPSGGPDRPSGAPAYHA